MARIGNDVGLLCNHAARFAGRIEAGRDGECRIRFRALGNIEVMLAYQSSDDEFGPSAELLYDACAKRVLCAEDAAVLGGRICLGLL